MSKPSAGLHHKTLCEIAPLITGLILLTAASAMAYENKVFTYNYRLTVTVRDHARLVSASNVVRVREQSSNGAILPPRFCGEATAVRLHDGKYVFALLGGPSRPGSSTRSYWRASPTQLLLRSLGLPRDWTWKDDSGIQQLSHPQPSVQLDLDQMPLLVTFETISDPKSIKQVDPTRPTALLGDGVSIEKVSVQPTTDRETTGRLASILPWLNPSQGYLDGSKWSPHGGTRYRTRQFSQCF